MVQTPTAGALAHSTLTFPPGATDSRHPAIILMTGPHASAPLNSLAQGFSSAGYAVVATTTEQAPQLGQLAAALRDHSRCNGRLALVTFAADVGLALAALRAGQVVAAVCYVPSGELPTSGALAPCERPLLLHLVGESSLPTTDNPCVEAYLYPGVESEFAQPDRPGFHAFSADLAMSRSLLVLRRAIGPRIDVAALWDHHCYVEFAAREVDATMATMVAEPYVNSVPVMTGGYGYDELRRFYARHFCDKNPADTKIVPISRTIAADRLVDETLFCFTHDIVIDWMLPGVAPTGRYVEVPLIAIIQFRGDKLVHEHIYWDQASVLAQIGLIDSKKLPVTGREQAQKVHGEKLPSNELMGSLWTDDGYVAPSGRIR